MSKFLVSLNKLESWFQTQKRILPWRDNPTVYRVWISEIMLQQTQVATVIPYFERFISSFPTVESLAHAVEEEVLRHWAGLGYYSRARNLQKGAQKIVQSGRFPRTREEWLEIPGVGNYTAGAILSIANGLPEAILDGNVERVLSRVRRVGRQKGDGPFKDRLWTLSRIFVETAHRHGIAVSDLNQALMELGATVCTPKKPRCGHCPLRDLCRAFAKSEVEAFPPKKKPKEWLQVQEELHCWVDSSDRVLLRRRSKGEWRAGLWDLLDVSPTKEYPQAKHLGEVETRHVVTRHKIRRRTQIWKVPRPKALGASQLQAAESNLPGPEGWGLPPSGDLGWISIQDPEVAVGSALRRSLDAVVRLLDQ